MIFKTLFLFYLPSNETYMQFSASTFMVPHLHEFYAVVQKMHSFGAIWCIFDANLATLLKIFMPEQHRP